VRNNSGVWIISNQHWPRAFLLAELLERAFEVETFERISDAIAAHDAASCTRPDLILLELIDQPLDGVELQKLRRICSKIVAMGGSAEFSGKINTDSPWIAVLRRPYSIGDICELVNKLIAS
jgi:hypothetical protein